jgi:putative NADH-flavin reductase
VRESGHLPKEWIPIVDAHIQVLRNLKQSSIDWTYFSPAGLFEPGERTGNWLLGTTSLRGCTTSLAEALFSMTLLDGMQVATTPRRSGVHRRLE